MEMGILYATREDVKSALDSKETARNNAQIDRALEAASRSVEALCHRRFYPEQATRSFAWPNGQYARAWRLWLDANELISITTLTAGGTTIASTDYFLEPNEYGPPYNRLEIDLASSAAFSSGDTHQRSIAITGLYGYRNDETLVSDVDEAMTATETDLDVTDSSNLGVGSVLRIGSERLLVTDKSMKSTFVTLPSPLTASVADQTLTGVSSGFFVGEVLLLDSERMLIVDKSATALTVKRAWDGSTLAAHTGSTIYAPRTLTVTRGALGTTAATMASGDDVYRWDPPGPVRTLTIAEAVNTVSLELVGYSRVLRSGEGSQERNRDQRGIDKLRQQVYDSHGRKARIRGV